MTCTVLSTMKNESPFILEWVAHYKFLGFDAIYVATNDCEDTTTDILDRLQQMDVVVHHPTQQWERSTPHKSALRQLREYKAVKKSDWIFVCDVDEFLNIHIGDGSLRALLDHHGGRHDVINIPWRNFGSSGIVEYCDEWVTRQFLMAEPAPQVDKKSAARAKALFTRPARFAKYGVHAPQAKEADEGSIVWVHADGAPYREWNDRNFDVAQLNHYAVRSKESYEVKKQRGRAHHINSALDDDYWARFDRNHESDTTIARYAEGVREWYDRLRADPELDALHRRGVEWHRAKAKSALVTSE